MCSLIVGRSNVGKTELVCNLAEQLGLLCITFNCSAQLECKTISRLFTGLCEQGAWANLGEFNALELEVLSVVANQLRLIKEALLRGDCRLFFG